MQLEVWDMMMSCDILPVTHKRKPKAVAASLSEPRCDGHNVVLSDGDVCAHAPGACSKCYEL